ncbi:MAG: ABC transporter permease [Actinobacteria bacterium]|nr:ABC transporter permease [Actinomycetota bacterium]
MQGSSLRRYLLVRVALTIPMLFILLTMIFLLMRVAPGDPITATVGARLSPEQVLERREALGLTDPLPEQYFRYLGDALTGDFGDPVTDRRSVLEIIGDTAPATFELAVAGMIVAVAVGIFVGAIAGRLRDTPFDIGGRLFGIVIYATPLFWLGLLFQLQFAVNWNWFPTGGRIQAFEAPPDTTGFYVLDSIIALDWSSLWSTLHHLMLPGLTLGLVIGGIFVRMVRVNMLQTLRADYVEAARARGIRERSVVFRHAFKNALVPIVTIMGLQFAILLGGAILTETVFSWPGVAAAIVGFIGARDYAAVQGLVTFIAIVIVGVSLLIDVMSGLIDPRVRY